MTPLLLAAIALSGAVTACAGYDDYREYRAAHPGWKPGFPRDRMALDELLAIVHAPPAGRNTTAIVTHLVVLGLGTDPWEEISLGEIRAGSFTPDPGRLYVVAARSQCLWTAIHTGTDRDDRRATGSFVWYLLRGDRLLAYEHTEFLERCNTRDLEKGGVHHIRGFEQTLRDHLDR
jgi:hypothetical protein